MMAETFSISKTCSPEPRIVTTLFSFEDWTWPALAILFPCVMIGLHTRLRVTNGGEDITIQSDPFAAVALVVVIIVALIRFTTFRKSKRKLQESLKGRDQFITFDEAGIEYGWVDSVTRTWPWASVASVKRDKDVLTVRLGGHRVMFYLAALEPAEMEILCRYLKERGLLD